MSANVHLHRGGGTSTSFTYYSIFSFFSPQTFFYHSFASILHQTFLSSSISFHLCYRGLPPSPPHAHSLDLDETLNPLPSNHLRTQNN